MNIDYIHDCALGKGLYCSSNSHNNFSIAVSSSSTLKQQYQGYLSCGGGKLVMKKPQSHSLKK